MGWFSARTGPAPEPDEYYSSDTDLYRIEQLHDGRALVEDCRTGALIDVPVSYIRQLHPVRTRDRSEAAAA